MIKLNAVLHTDGKGLYTSEKRAVRVTSVELSHVDTSSEYGELRVYFDEDTWDVEASGLIYTDSGFVKGVNNLLSDLGIVGEASYSEQGMQGYDYVSFDVDGDVINTFAAVS